MPRPVPGPVWDLLQVELPSDPNALLFPRHRGGYLPIGECSMSWYLTDLRHTTASLAISAGASVKAVQRLLGHATAAMTRTVMGTRSVTI